MSQIFRSLRRHAAVILAFALLMGGGGVAYAVAAHQAGDRASKASRIYACVKTSTGVMSQGKANRACPAGSKKISWNVAGKPGATGPAGVPGPAGPAGAAGADGVDGTDGVDGEDGAPGAPGANGSNGAAGTNGTDGADGTDGTDGADAVSEFAEFFALAPPDNSAVVALGSDVDFPQDGPTSGTIARTGADSFLLPAIGVYRVSFSVPVQEAGQLMLTLDGADLAYTVVGRATGTSTIAGETLVQTTAVNTVLTVRNPVSNNTALTVVPLAGGNSPSAATLIIEQLG